MEQHAGLGEGHLQPAHLSLLPDDAGAYCEAEKASGDPAEHLRGHQSTMGSREPTEMAVPPLEPGLNQAGEAGIPQDQLLSLLENMDAALKQDSTVLCQFKALRPLSEEMRGESVAFKISVALHGPSAATLHQSFATLDGCMALQLIGANLHRERQRQFKEANLVRECVFGRPSSGLSC